MSQMPYKIFFSKEGTLLVKQDNNWERNSKKMPHIY
jgi:hypothetical protein